MVRAQVRQKSKKNPAMRRNVSLARLKNMTRLAAISNRRVGQEWEKHFWEQVCKQNSCWIWTGSRHNCGYGVICRDGRLRYAHREAWRLAHGTSPKGLVCHHCDNPACVRPSHLYLGDKRSNMEDLVRRHGHPLHNHPEYVVRGSKHPRKLHPEKWPRGDAHWTRVHPEWVCRGVAWHLKREERKLHGKRALGNV